MREKIGPGFQLEQLGRWLSVLGREIQEGDQILGSEKRMIDFEYTESEQNMWSLDEKVLCLRRESEILKEGREEARGCNASFLCGNENLG